MLTTVPFLAQLTPDSSERTAAASRQQQRGDSRLGSNAAQRQLVLLRRRLRLIIRRLTIRLVEAQGGFSSSNGVLEVKPGEARQETPFLPALAGTLP